MSDNDKRHLTQMQRQIESYRSKRIPLHSLIGDLEFLLSYVESSDRDWKERVLSRIGEVEDIYASVLDKKAGVFDDVDKHLLSAAIDAIEELVGSDLGKARTPSDVSGPS